MSSLCGYLKEQATVRVKYRVLLVRQAQGQDDDVKQATAKDRSRSFASLKDDNVYEGRSI